MFYPAPQVLDINDEIVNINVLWLNGWDLCHLIEECYKIGQTYENWDFKFLFLQ